MNKRKGLALICFVSGILLTPIALILAFFSAGAGHGDYALTRLLFPYSMLLTLTAGDQITNPLIVIGLIQFPIYGVLSAVGALRSKRVLISVLIAIGVVHLIAAITCFSGILPNFS